MGAIPLLVLATLATVIASQAVISGAFSVARQAVQMGLLPRMLIVHTSGHEQGQIYVPFTNWTLYLAVVALVVGFQNSSNLAAAYGIAVTGTMLIDTVLLGFDGADLALASALAGLVRGALLLVDIAFFKRQRDQDSPGGWPDRDGAGLCSPCSPPGARGVAWCSGEIAAQGCPERVHRHGRRGASGAGHGGVHDQHQGWRPGRAAKITLKHNQVLHERVALVTVETADTPHVSEPGFASTCIASERVRA